MAMKKRGLGKGLAALIPEEPIEKEEQQIQDEDRIMQIDISLIEPNNEQPRRSFNQESLEELSESIKRHGVLQPIIVRKIDLGYQIVAGERRWRASKEAGLKTIPCILRDLEQILSTELALIENIQREDLNPIEEAYAYKSLTEKYELTQDEVSQIIGKSRSHIANLMRLLNLNDEVIKLIESGKLSNGHGRALLSISDINKQKEAAKVIIQNGLSVRDTEKLVKEVSNTSNKKDKISKEKIIDPAINDIEESLRKVLGTKVQIIKGRKKGKIEIEYYNDEDLERIIDILSDSLQF